MIIDCISDLHGHYPQLEGGDLLIVAGDLTSSDACEQHDEFCQWLDSQAYNAKIVIAGNHDNNIDADAINCLRGCHYLCDSGTEFEGLKIWGSPWTKKFEGMNPNCMAFTCNTEEELAEKWKLIPDDIDILITHSPPYGVLDWNFDGKRCGSESLREFSIGLNNLKLFVFGHLHEAYGMIDVNQVISSFPTPKCKSFPKIVNASHVNEKYEPVNKPIRIIL